MRCSSCSQENRPERLYCSQCGAALGAACPTCGAHNEPGERFCGRCGAGLGPGAPAPATPTIPRTIAGGRYQVHRLLGEGGKKRVYLATDTRLERDVALALIKTEGLDEAGLDRVQREARAMGRLGDHPQIVTVFDVGEEAGQPYIVSQYMAGGSVDDLLQAAEHHRLPLEQTLRLAIDVCCGLEHAHQAGVIHRDLKPSNIWLTADGRPKLGDFGLALSRDRPRLTIEGMMVGTVAYMPPEQALGRPAEPRTDLYALGAMLYEMVAGRPPFLGDDAVAVISQHLNTAPVAPSWHNAEVPPALEALILRMLAKAPEERPASAAAVQEALAAIAAAPAGAERGAQELNPLDRLAGGVFVGRAREIEELRTAVNDARSGNGRLVLLAGEPGIGKTRTATELATYARLRGFQVLWGRCHESGGAPAYWPWVQIIRAYLPDRDPKHLMSEMGPGAAAIAQVVSDVRDRLPDLPGPPPLEPEQARFRLFDSISTFVKNAASRQPLFLILDDLHWADKPSLLLLEFLAREMGSARLVIAATYRDMEFSREHPLFDSLGELTRAHVTRRVALRGLGAEDVGRYIEMTSGLTPPAGLVATVHRETEGNPFFLGEVVSLLAAEGRLTSDARADWSFRVPEGVREVISRRLVRLSAECNTLLTVASVIGREFGVDVLERVADLPPDRVVDVLEEATAARVIAEVPRVAGRYRFAHALIRETLYEELSATRRVRLHRRIGEVLEDVHQARPAPYLAELAYHFAESIEGNDATKAIDYARRAGDRALAQLAYEEGARLYRMAIELLTANSPADEQDLADLLLDLGEAERQTGDVERARETIRRAADLARRLGAAELLARAALAYGGSSFVFALNDEYEMALLEQGLAGLDETDSHLRARLMARLAMHLYFAGNIERCATLSEQAVAMARRIGNAATLAYALHNRHIALWGPQNVEERLAIATEMMRLAETAGDREQVGRGRHFKIVDLLELGDVHAAYREMEAQSRLADELKQPLFQWHRAMYQAMRALFEGRFDQGERLAQEALAIGQRASPDAMETYGVQTYAVYREQGRATELEPTVVAFAEQQPSVRGWRCALTWIYAETGRHAEAQRELDLLAASDFTDFRQEIMWLPSMTVLAQPVATLRDARRAALLYDLMLPYADHNVVVGGAVACAGSIAYYLGLCATATGRWTEAMLHFESAIRMNTRMGARPWVAYAEYAYGEMLLARGEPGDAKKALELVGRALETAQQLEMKHLVEKALAAKIRAQGISSVDFKTSIDAVVTTVQKEQPDLARHAAPDGTVTVLFSDIEGFSAMTERLGDLRAQEVLRAHAALVREQIGAHGGLEVKSQGDGFMIVFSSARRALLCAIAIQRALAERADDPREQVRVRMGLHTGEVIREADDFFGRNVILAARIAKVARGGEILVSSVLRELTESAGDIRFGGGRSVDLKGLSGTRQVYDVRWTDDGQPLPEEPVTTDSDYVFRCEGEYWTLTYEGQVCRLRDAKGLHHIALLLRNPGQQFEVRDLAAEAAPELDRPSAELQAIASEVGAGGLGDAGVVLDAKAKAAYKRRMDDLREELEEAERFNDRGRIENARDEIDFLTQQLSAAVGVGGRDRRAASTAERARLTVTKRIKDALAKIREGHPTLGQHLSGRIKTGYLCAYSPDPERPISWKV